MKSLFNPKILIVINTLPIVILFVLFLGQYNIIKTLLTETNILYWTFFGLILGFFGVLNLAYSIILIIKKKNISVLYGIIALICYIPFIYLFYFFSDKILPFQIPSWMVSFNTLLHTGTFLMPTLAYSLFIIVVHFTLHRKNQSSLINFLIALSIPLAGYLFVQIILPLWKKRDYYGETNTHAYMIILIAAAIIFLFFLIRSIFIIVVKKADSWKRFQLIWKIPIAIVFPILGLLINNGIILAGRFLHGNDGNTGNTGIFGNFSNIWFYILAVVSGILICLPNIENKIYRLALFAGRSATLIFTFYFFLVFLPFFPFSIIVIIFFGFGFLMLTPLALFIIHAMEIRKDFKFLKLAFQPVIVKLILISCILIIPVFITITYVKDKLVLNKTLEYLYAPDYTKQYSINKTSLRKTISAVKNHKSADELFLLSMKMPYLSSYYNWIVLNNLTLSDDKINFMEAVFYGIPIKNRPPEIIGKGVEITNISTTSVYDSSQNAWISLIDLEIQNNTHLNFMEYATQFTLPQGCWISDYYLYVEDKKEHGILSEKRTAMWVYSNIVNNNRDPGILFYLTGNDVSFRVFPFSEDETRKTGIEFIHKEPVMLTIDDFTINLGSTEETVIENIETENYMYISSQQKQTLNSVIRPYYYHFLVDVSKNSSDYSDRIERFLTENKANSQNAQISFVNSYVKTFSIDDNWKQLYESQTFEGGFFLERAVQTVLFNSYKNKTNPYIIVVTDNTDDSVIDKAVLENDFSDFKFAFPEINAEVLELTLPDGSVVYLSNNEKPEIILINDVFTIADNEIMEKNWLTALAMQAKHMSHTLHPHIKNKEWREMLKYSFVSKIMTPVTSYIVVENEAQRAVLRDKQEKVISGGKLLDLDENSRRMSEPSILILSILLIGALWFIKRRKIFINK